MLGEPVEIDTPFGGTVDGNRCACGAVYVYDRTGRMLGEAFSEALAMAYDWDYDKAFEAPEEDREEAVINYIAKVRQFVRNEDTRFTKAPRFVFIRRKRLD